MKQDFDNLNKVEIIDSMPSESVSLVNQEASERKTENIQDNHEFSDVLKREMPALFCDVESSVPGFSDLLKKMDNAKVFDRKTLLVTLAESWYWAAFITNYADLAIPKDQQRCVEEEGGLLKDTPKLVFIAAFVGIFFTKMIYPLIRDNTLTNYISEDKINALELFVKSTKEALSSSYFLSLFKQKEGIINHLITFTQSIVVGNKFVDFVIAVKNKAANAEVNRSNSLKGFVGILELSAGFLGAFAAMHAAGDAFINTNIKAYLNYTKDDIPPIVEALDKSNIYIATAFGSFGMSASLFKELDHGREHILSAVELTAFLLVLMMSYVRCTTDLKPHLDVKDAFVWAIFNVLFAYLIMKGSELIVDANIEKQGNQPEEWKKSSVLHDVGDAVKEKTLELVDKARIGLFDKTANGQELRFTADPESPSLPIDEETGLNNDGQGYGSIGIN